jgi:hypothetical protein
LNKLNAIAKWIAELEPDKAGDRNTILGFDVSLRQSSAP